MAIDKDLVDVVAVGEIVSKSLALILRNLS